MSQVCHKRMQYVHMMNNSPPLANLKNFFTPQFSSQTLLPVPAYITTPSYCSSYARDQAMRTNDLQAIAQQPFPTTNAGVPENACIAMRGD